jgi:hypothetical protein
MYDTDPLRQALRELPVLDVSPAKSRAILAAAQASLGRGSAAGAGAPNRFEALWSRLVAPALVGVTVASYLIWAVTAAGALYR